VSAMRYADRPLSRIQFWVVLGAMAVSGVLALVVLSSVAGKHGTCPTPSQISRPGASICWAAYDNQSHHGVVGHPAAS
jgi:hypothetical protein